MAMEIRTFASTLSQWADYSLEGEKAHLLTAGYNFTNLGVPGLNIDFATAKGKDAKNHKDHDRREYSTYTSYTSYTFDGKLEGLELAWLHVNYKLDQDGKSISRDKSNRLYLKYKTAVF